MNILREKGQGEENTNMEIKIAYEEKVEGVKVRFA